MPAEQNMPADGSKPPPSLEQKLMDAQSALEQARESYKKALEAKRTSLLADKQWRSEIAKAESETLRIEQDMSRIKDMVMCAHPDCENMFIPIKAGYHNCPDHGGKSKANTMDPATVLSTEKPRMVNCYQCQKPHIPDPRHRYPNSKCEACRKGHREPRPEQTSPKSLHALTDQYLLRVKKFLTTWVQNGRLGKLESNIQLVSELDDTYLFRVTVPESESTHEIRIPKISS